MTRIPRPGPDPVDAELAAAFARLRAEFERSDAPPEILDLARRLDEAIGRANRTASAGEQAARPRDRR